MSMFEQRMAAARGSLVAPATSSQDAEREPAATTAMRRADARLLVVNRGQDTFATMTLAALPTQLEAGDVLVVNDAATLPASLSGSLERTGAAVEARLLESLTSRETAGRWRAVLLGAGDWRTPTELRAPPPAVWPEDRLRFGDALRARITAVDPRSPRLVEFELEALDEDRAQSGADSIVRAIYCVGRPVQYAYHRAPLALWDQQTVFATRPFALEPPSASLHFDWALVFALQRRGVEIVRLTHATTLSSTGDPVVDALLPPAEPFDVPSSTAVAVNAARSQGRRVIAAGTGVVRALESASVDSQGGSGATQVLAGRGVATLKLGPSRAPRIVTGLVTGMHAAASSHMALVGAFAPVALIGAGYEQARREGFLWHEYGDLCLIV